MASGKTTTGGTTTGGTTTGGTTTGGGGGGGTTTTTTKPILSFTTLNLSGATKEDETLVASGKLTAVSSDPADTMTWSLKSNATGTYGSLQIQADGTWTYTLNNSAAIVQSLTSADAKTDTFTVQVIDAFGTSATKSIVVNVAGTNEKPVITAAAGQDAGAVAEDGVSKVSGLLSASSLEKNVTLSWSVENTGQGAYGTLAVDKTGGWTYNLDNTKAAVQALHTGETLSEVFTVKVTDNTGQFSTRDITITIAGANDAPVVATGPGQDQGDVQEDGSLTATGQLVASSVDHDTSLSFATLKPDGKGNHGYLTITPSGQWSYALDNTDPAVQALTAGQSLSDSINVLVTDDKGMVTKQGVTITIAGADDAPMIAATGTSGMVQEDGVQVATGQVSATSADAGTILTWSTATPVAQGSYGSLTIDGTGAWSYTLDNSNPLVQALATGQSLTDQISVTVTDQKGMSASSQIALQILGLDETAVVDPNAPLAMPIDPNVPDTGGTGGGGANSGGVNSGGVNSGKTIPATAATTTWTYSAVPGYTTSAILTPLTSSASSFVGPNPFTALQSQAAVINDVTGALFGATTGIRVDTGSFQIVSGSSSVMHYDGGLPLGIGAGVLITSGGMPGTSNTVPYFSVDNFMPGDADLNAIVQTVFPTTGYDATTISFSFTVTDPTLTGIRFNAVFGSDEYPEWVDTIFVDIGAVLVNGSNVALFDPANPLTPLSIIGSNLSANYFINNTDGHLPIEYDGVTHVLDILAPVHLGLNTIKLGISDTGDHIYDSGLFISNLVGTTYTGTGVYIDHSGTEAPETQSGGVEAEVYDAMGGDDVVFAYEGNDVVLGGAGNDRLDGGGGADVMQGGAGSDTFVYERIGDSAPGAMDKIVDFSALEGDKIDLSAIDAIPGTATKDAFTWVPAFSGAAGELTVGAQAGGGWLVQGDVDGDGLADLAILVQSTEAPAAADFLL